MQLRLSLPVNDSQRLQPLVNLGGKFLSKESELFGWILMFKATSHFVAVAWTLPWWATRPLDGETVREERQGSDCVELMFGMSFGLEWATATRFYCYSLKHKLSSVGLTCARRGLATIAWRAMLTLDVWFMLGSLKLIYRGCKCTF